MSQSFKEERPSSSLELLNVETLKALKLETFF